jgi:hypothetical protein
MHDDPARVVCKDAGGRSDCRLENEDEMLLKHICGRYEVSNEPCASHSRENHRNEWDNGETQLAGGECRRSERLREDGTSGKSTAATDEKLGSANDSITGARQVKKEETAVTVAASVENSASVARKSCDNMQSMVRLFRR